jgi:hypothetical protein
MTETDCAAGSMVHQAEGRLRLRVRGGGVARLVDVTAACCRIGSAPGCTLRLRAPGVRDVHCLIVRGRGISTVRDLAGDTLLNGASFHEAPLAVGDRLRIGPLEVLVEADTRAEQAELPLLLGAPIGEQLAELIAERQTAPLGADSDLRQQLAQAAAAAEDAWQRVSARQDQAEAAATSRFADIESRLHGLEDVKPHLADVNVRLESLASHETALRQLADQLGAARSDSEAQRSAHAENVLRLEQMAARLSKLEALMDETSHRCSQPQLPVRDAQQDERLHDLASRCEQLEAVLAELRGNQGISQGELQAWQLECRERQEDAQTKLEELAQQLRALSADRWSAMHSATHEERKSAPSRRAVESDTPSTGAVTSALATELPSGEAQETPRTKDELVFEPLSTQAPLSTAEVFQRLGTTVEFDDETPAHPLSRGAGEASAKTLAPQSRAAQTPSHADEDQDSIEEYMARLLGRSRTTPLSELKMDAKPATPSASPESPSPAPPSQGAPAEPYRPRAVAPELSTDMSAMRALANNTARQAIDRHARTSQAIATRGKLALALIALALSVILVSFSANSAMAFWSSLVAMIVAAYWGARYVLLTRSLKRVVREEQESGKKEEPST